MVELGIGSIWTVFLALLLNIELWHNAKDDKKMENLKIEKTFGQLSIFDGTPQSTLNQSIKLIQTFEESAIKRNPLGYVVGYSGGKDSDVLLDLFKKSGVRFFVFHNHTTLDAPETVYYVRRKFYELELQGIPCKIYYPQMNFLEFMS